MKFFKLLKSLFQKEQTSTQEIETGFIKFFNRSRGYGFIQTRESNDRVFVHISELKDSVRPGDQVRFEIAADPKGPRAVNVQLVTG